MTRNPRRAYDRDGQEIRPAAVASHMALGLRRVEVFCNECNHNRSGIDVSDLPPRRRSPTSAYAMSAPAAGRRT